MSCLNCFQSYCLFWHDKCCVPDEGIAPDSFVNNKIVQTDLTKDCYRHVTLIKSMDILLSKIKKV